ncbi:bifunctional GNAT family N-acetyltransferase/hotdog fold thioesterase [Colwellia sp. MEBiC06753]
MYQVKAPENKTEFNQYYQFRWQWLRAPWQQPEGSEKDELEAQSIHRMIVNEQGEIIAVGRLHKISQTRGQIRYMAVADSYQGQGLGRIVIDALEQEAIKHGVNEIELNAREIALDFYKRLGYQLIQPAHLLWGKIQHYLMTKRLSASSTHLLTVSEQLTHTWHNTIPMSKAMNIRVTHFDGDTLFTDCDIAFNKNIHNTMFAGSISTLATLTGWGWVYLALEQADLQGEIVLADASIKYLAPIAGAGVAKTDVSKVSGDVANLTTNGKARIEVAVDVLTGDKVAAKFTGQYVVMAKGNSHD